MKKNNYLGIVIRKTRKDLGIKTEQLAKKQTILEPISRESRMGQ